MAKHYVRQHYEYATTGEPSQECDQDYGGSEPPKTDFDGTNGRKGSPHGDKEDRDE